MITAISLSATTELRSQGVISATRMAMADNCRSRCLGVYFRVGVCSLQRQPEAFPVSQKDQALLKRGQHG